MPTYRNVVVWARQIVHSENPSQEDWEGYTPIFLRDGLQVLDDNRAGEQNHYTLMFDEPQAFSSVSDLINEGEYGAVSWDDSATYEFIGVTSIENVPVSNIVLDNVVIEKEYEPSFNGVGIANLLNTTNKVLTYQGKVVALRDPNGNYQYRRISEDTADNWVTTGKIFSEITESDTTQGLISFIKFDDSTPVSINDCILSSEVPGSADFSFVLEPAFIRV